ncbi:MAG: Cys-tRNA(Pro) deacylase [Acidimicrobiia bacterium]|nr:Cys-tRNA(Pro) deacylase [Acidimicrobiia bacterium]MDH5505315.1 Cys-tRNA(Pro) deacylase [Acidimicrobiia bacterium]
MSATPATTQLDRLGVTYRLHHYDVSINDELTITYGEAVAKEIGVDAERVFKTLVATVDGDLVAGIVPVTRKLNLKALAKATGGKKASMADPAQAERATGYVVGGISPFGQKKRLRTVADQTVTHFETVYVSAGRRGLQVSLSPTDLVRSLEATVADIAGP